MSQSWTFSQCKKYLFPNAPGIWTIFEADISFANGCQWYKHIYIYIYNINLATASPNSQYWSPMWLLECYKYWGTVLFYIQVPIFICKTKSLGYLWFYNWANTALWVTTVIVFAQSCDGSHNRRHDNRVLKFFLM